MKTIIKRFTSVFLAFCMILVFSQSIMVNAVDEIPDYNSNEIEYYIEYDCVNQTYQRIPVNSIPDYANTTTTTYVLNAMSSELPRLQDISDSYAEPLANLNDDAYAFTPPTSDPYSGVVLIMFYTDGQWHRGTGFMVAPDVLVTAAHNMVNYKDGEFQSFEFRVYPNYNSLSTSPLSTNNDYILPLMWTCYDYADAIDGTDGNATNIDVLKYDWCVVQLQESIPNAYNFACSTGVKTSWFTKYRTSGYPYCVVSNCTNNECNHTRSFLQCTSEGLIKKKDDYMVYYTNNTRGGMSGGPLYKKSNNVCYAIITSEYLSVSGTLYNAGTIINDKIYNAISYYIERGN